MKRLPDRLLRRLAAFEDPTESMAGWLAELGEDVALVERFLRPVRGTATTWPCGVDATSSCRRRVVRHRDGDVVAVCDEDPARCDRIEIQRADLALQRLDLARVAAELRARLSSAPRGADAGEDSAVVVEVALGGERLRVVVTWHTTTLGLLGVADEHVGRGGATHVVVLAPLCAPPADQAVFERAGCSVIPMALGVLVADRWELDLGDWLVERRQRFAGIDPSPWLRDRYDLVLDPAGVRYWARGRLVDLGTKPLPRRLLESLAGRSRVLVVRKDLHGAVWPDVAFGRNEAWETNLRSVKRDLVVALERAGAGGDWIGTTPGSDVDGGYFLALDPERVLWWSDPA